MNNLPTIHIAFLFTELNAVSIATNAVYTTVRHGG